MSHPHPTTTAAGVWHLDPHTAVIETLTADHTYTTAKSIADRHEHRLGNCDHGGEYVRQDELNWYREHPRWLIERLLSLSHYLTYVKQARAAEQNARSEVWGERIIHAGAHLGEPAALAVVATAGVVNVLGRKLFFEDKHTTAERVEVATLNAAWMALRVHLTDFHKQALPTQEVNDIDTVLSLAKVNLGL